MWMILSFPVLLSFLKWFLEKIKKTFHCRNMRMLIDLMFHWPKRSDGFLMSTKERSTSPSIRNLVSLSWKEIIIPKYLKDTDLW